MKNKLMKSKTSVTKSSENGQNGVVFKERNFNGKPGNKLNSIMEEDDSLV